MATEPTQPRTAVEGRALAIRAQADSVRAVLTTPAMTQQLRAALPRHLTPERLVRLVMTSVQQSPKLLECDRQSLFAAIMTCAQLGLEPILGRAYLVPFRDKVQFIAGYKGLIDLAVNSGEVTKVFANIVYAADEFEYEYGVNERLFHKPSEAEDRGEITHVYALAWFKRGGPPYFEVMLRREVDAIRDRSQGWQAYKAAKIKENPWHTDYPQMARKTGIRRISNYLPLDVQKAIALSDAHDLGRHGHIDAQGDLVIEQLPAIDGSAPQPAPLTRLDAFAAEGDAPPEEPFELSMDDLLEKAGALLAVLPSQKAKKDAMAAAFEVSTWKEAQALPREKLEHGLALLQRARQESDDQAEAHRQAMAQNEEKAGVPRGISPQEPAPGSQGSLL